MVSIHFKILALDYSITKKVIRYLLDKNQFSWCSLNPFRKFRMRIFIQIQNLSFFGLIIYYNTDNGSTKPQFLQTWPPIFLHRTVTQDGFRIRSYKTTALRVRLWSHQDVNFLRVGSCTRRTWSAIITSATCLISLHTYPTYPTLTYTFSPRVWTRQNMKVTLLICTFVVSYV
jgi:hypothetical protein